ncbi:AraC family transcriptional regulator [Leptolyngbyaceae cyanobacterium CCMR0082]|uniref:AraC family transcriptional regulator n=2 Tax=Adonisia turfae TaxID=2950184 RepID=A0A6M0S1K8_9CYAN|nr:AraC family transcriptional regulator [Adonisia turfae]MDV3347342.1 AraC family transcriptional regulator [Leptothoe sp. LEGE 181152]NEZ55863.1 AraC family transcriptional regulator [Adonisia turfae CCMR0081]NEZ61812.1 AraC family transcriptional regulator [Adonisia turfae CCMR0082]
MKVNFSVRNIDELFAELSHQEDLAISSEEYEHTLIFPSRICNGLVKSYKLRPGFELSVQNTLFPKRLILETEFSHPASLTLGFCVSGSSRGTIKGVKEELSFKSGQIGWGVTSDTLGTIEYCAGKPFSFINISMDTEVLDTLLNGRAESLPTQFQRLMKGKDRSPYLQTDWMTHTMKMAMQQVLKCPYHGLTKRLYLESKALEVFACFLDHLSSSAKTKSRTPALKPTDIDRIHWAKEILLNDLAHPPSLASLAKLVGLNDYKLKIGFRQVLGKTAFGYLREHRMHHAKDLLATRALSIVEIARAVGYASETSFSAAFKEKFGVPPTVYRASIF